jgi:anti-sigma B factor antagonist
MRQVGNFMCAGTMNEVYLPSQVPTLPGCGVDGLLFSAELRDGSMVVTIRGEIDVVTCDQLDRQLAQASQASSRVIVDLSQVDFMDSSALAVIARNRKAIVASGGTLTLAGPRYEYLKALWITGLADRLPLYDSVEHALATD